MNPDFDKLDAALSRLDEAALIYSLAVSTPQDDRLRLDLEVPGSDDWGVGTYITLRRDGTWSFVEPLPAEDLPTKEFHLTWEIDIDATSPEAAAEMARDIQLDPTNIATVFMARERESQVETRVDLGEPE